MKNTITKIVLIVLFAITCLTIMTAQSVEDARDTYVRLAPHYSELVETLSFIHEEYEGQQMLEQLEKLFALGMASEYDSKTEEEYDDWTEKMMLIRSAMLIYANRHAIWLPVSLNDYSYIDQLLANGYQRYISNETEYIVIDTEF